MLTRFWFLDPPQPFGTTLPQKVAIVLDFHQKTEATIAADLAGDGDKFNPETRGLQALLCLEGPVTGGVGGQEEHH